MNPFTYTLVRYAHDAQGGEFVNVGVILLAPAAGFVRMASLQRFERVSVFFGRRAPAAALRTSLRYLQRRVDEVADFAFRDLAPTKFRGALELARTILPADDSALQMSEERGGLTANPEATLRELFERHVLRFTETPLRNSRSDQDVIPKLRESFSKAKVLDQVGEPRTISSPNFDYEFPFSWVNGRLHACEVVSLDLVNEGDIVEKANKWLGRGHTLRQGDRDFNLVLFLGRPREEKNLEAFERARKILNEIPGPSRLVDEREADSFAAEVAWQLQHH